MKYIVFKYSCLICMLLLINPTFAQIAKCKGKYLGNIIAGNVPSTYTANWNQVTSENASKWGSVEGTKGQYNFGGSDICYNWAKNNNGIFKYHTLVWGGQAPGWTQTESTASIMAAIDPYFKAVRDHYAPMGGLKMIDVLNEPVNTPMLGNLKAALTAGYKAEPANAGDLNNQYGWAIWCFQVARKYFPDATLLINEYNIEMNWNNCRAPYIAMVQAIKNAPNITDGKKNLIDGVGLQAHGINNLTAANFRACIDEIWNKTGVPIHITEFDATADPNEAKQQSVYSTLVPVAWEHPHVAGITFWGYIQGQTWIGGNKQTGSGGTDSGIMYANGNDRPAMTWMRQYFASQPSLSCCPAPGPFASCTSTNPVPVVSITAPSNNTVYTEGDNITITATATITTGSISKVDFYNGTTLLGTDASSPYTYTLSGAVAGNYVITAKATSALNAATTSTAVTVQVAKAVYQTGTAPVIDGTVDGLWSNFTSVPITRLLSGTVSSATDLSGNWKAAWDASNLYVLVQVTDDVKRNDAGTDVYNDDNVEVYIDLGNTKATTYGTNDHQYTFRWNDATAAYEINGHSVTGISKGITSTATGYIVEVSIPWSTIGGTAAANSFQGFDVMINDDDDGAARDGKLAWSATTDDTWSNPSLMGTVVLKGLNCTAPTASITTTTATTFCSGGSVVLNGSTGTGYSYVWKNGTTTITGATTQSYTATSSGSYTVTITNGGGCSATSAGTTVTVNALPTITQYAQIDGGIWNQVSTGTVCAGSTVVLGPQPNVTTGWAWTGPNGYSSASREVTLAGLATTQGGVYTATYTDGNTCKGTSTFTLTVNALPAAAITTTTPTTFCTGGNVVLTASAGSSYVWKNGMATITGATAQNYTATAAGSYAVEVTNANGCKATSAATVVTVSAAPNAPAVTTPVTYCQNATAVQLTATGTALKWYADNTTTTALASAPTPSTTTVGTTTYFISQTTNGCESTRAQITVTVNALPTAMITAGSATTFCAGGSVTLNASTGSSYIWKNGGSQVGTGSTYSAATTGSYTVEVTNANGCKATSAATAVTVNTAPNAPAVTTPVMYCQNATAAQLTATGSNLKWYADNTTTTALASAPTPSTTTVGTTTYFVSQTTNGCESTRAQIGVTVNALPTAMITAGSATTFCAGGSVTLTASTGTAYVWKNGANQVGTAATYSATAAGSYTVEITNANGCKATSAATAVTVNTAPNAPAVTTPVTYCQNEAAAQLTATGTALKWYADNTTTTALSAAPNPSTAAAGTTSYFVSQTTNGCESTRAQITVTVNALPTATITANGSTSIPQGGSVVLTASSGSSYVWYKGGAQVGTGQSYTATAAGSYTVEVTNSNNCKATSLATDVNSASNQPSQITITSPTANTTVQGTITITANVTDPDGSIVLVEYLDGNDVIGTSTSAPYSFDWTNPGEGTHVITVRVTDSNGGITTSAPVTITSSATTTGVQLSNTLHGNVYPNPSNRIVFIDSDTDLSGASFMLVDVLGNEHRIGYTATGLGAQVDVSNLSDGAYILIIKKDNSVLRKKITVIR